MDQDDDGVLFYAPPVTLYLRPRDKDRCKLLEILFELIHLYSTSPRKWLRYCGYAICGCGGDLYIRDDENSEIPLRGAEMDTGAQAGANFVFRPEAPPDFADVALRERSHSDFSSTSQYIPENLQTCYGKCPFTHVTLASCHACHLIPRAKGEDYLRRVLQARGDPRPEVSIDGAENLLVMDVMIHNMFDKHRNVAFMQAPNNSLKSTDIPRTDNPPARNIGPDTSLVTVHCFDSNPEKREEAAH